MVIIMRPRREITNEIYSEFTRWGGALLPVSIGNNNETKKKKEAYDIFYFLNV